jgi:hypothetical protein
VPGRVAIEPEVAADVLFASDRTCCVCQIPGKRVQLHHIDENSANSVRTNLAVLCFDCHDETQIRGGFGRRLDTAQVRKYRDDWEARIRKRRDDADRLAVEVLSRAGVALEVQASDAIAMVDGIQISLTTSSVHVADMSEYIRTLPELHRRAYAQARPEWDSGSTARIVDASYRVIDVLQEILVTLASYYPAGHFDGENPRDYISELIATRFRWHRYHYEPHGAGQDGTIVNTLVVGSVLSDAERMVEEMVFSLTLARSTDNWNFESWKARLAERVLIPWPQ